MKLDIKKKIIAGFIAINTILIFIVAPMVGVFIVVVILIGAGYFLFIKRKNANKSQSETELEEYLKIIKASRSLPIIVDTGLKLQQGENVFLYEKILFLNMANKEFGVKKQEDDKSHHPKYPGFIESDKGNIALTNLRVIFRGEKTNMDLPLNVPIEFYSQSDLLFISSGTALGNTIAFNVKHSGIWCETSKIVRNAKDPVNMTLEDLELLNLKN